jgi:uncharacterized protein YkwD
MRYRANTYDRRFFCRSLAAVALAASVLVPSAPPAHAALTFEEKALQLINGVRAAAGVPPVQASAPLADIAGAAPYNGCGFPVSGRAADMGMRNYLDHAILNCGNQSMTHMLKAAGISYSGAAENIGYYGGPVTPEDAANQIHHWLVSSPVHKANMVNRAYTHVGIGSWRTPPGATWKGPDGALPNVYVSAQIFAGSPTVTPKPSTGARYHPLTPKRILDTRSATPLGPGATMDLQVTGAGGVPSTGVSAVVLNVAVTAPTAPSYLTVFPSGESRPLAANLNYVAGQTVPNMVTAKLGAGGRVALFNAAGTTHVIADVAGWYDDGTPTTGARYHPLTPSRILDTRTTGPIGSGATIAAQVTGQGGVPSTGVSAVVMNVAVTGPTAQSYLTVFPAGEAMPVAANLNYLAGQTVPNLVTAKLGAGGRVSLFNAAGTADVVIDVAGWYDDGTSATGARYYPVTPSRILDTRTAAIPVTSLLATDLQVAGRGGVPSTGVAAVVMNVTVTEPTAPGYLTTFPTGEPKPWAANLNFLAGQTVPNLISAKLGAGGKVSLANAAGTTHVVADVAGWFDGG